MFLQNKERNMEVIEALANGIDPISGEVFPVDSPYQQLEITRVLFNVLNELKKANQASNQGGKWTELDDQKLKVDFNMGLKISELAKTNKRSNGAIRSRLIKLGIIQQK
jgi:hypothetical protein